MKEIYIQEKLKQCSKVSTQMFTETCFTFQDFVTNLPLRLGSSKRL